MGGFGVFLVLSFIHCTSLSEFCRPLRQTASFFFFQSYLNARQSSTISLLKNKSRIVSHCNNLLTEKCKNYWSLFSVADTQVQCILVACLGCPCKAKPAEQNLSPISTYRTALLSLNGTLELLLIALDKGDWTMEYGSQNCDLTPSCLHQSPPKSSWASKTLKGKLKEPLVKDYSSSPFSKTPMLCFVLSKTALKDSPSTRSCSLNRLLVSLFVFPFVPVESSSAKGLETCKIQSYAYKFARGAAHWKQ